MKRKRHPQDKEYLQIAARRVEASLPDQHAFILLASPLGEGGRLNYVANCNREDAINLLKEFLIRCGHEEDWMKHI